MIKGIICFRNTVILIDDNLREIDFYKETIITNNTFPSMENWIYQNYENHEFDKKFILIKDIDRKLPSNYEEALEILKENCLEVLL